MPSSELRHICFPYCLDKNQDGSWVVLNRNYKPIGFNTSDYINYSNFPISINCKLTPSMLKKISYTGKFDEKEIRVYLYNDECLPTKDTKSMNAYLERLSKLMKIKTN